jgi:3D (Asp-Asp-Asp) domain-containing protein
MTSLMRLILASRDRMAAPRARGAAGWIAAAVLGLGGILAACATTAPFEGPLLVTVSAYNSLPGQTHGDPSMAAWGDMLEPGMKVVAVSRDLLALGLTRGARVRIEGLTGDYVVLDKMARRWSRRVDIYMGEDVEAARAWGVRHLHIRWQSPAAN